MANPSVTYTFANSTTSDAGQVNQNFTDLINGATDGTKDYSISALTAAGTATLNGNVVLGASSAKDITFSGSLASSIPIKTTNTYDIGAATLGLRSLYLADAGSAARSTRLLGGTVASSYTYTLPISAGTAGQAVHNIGSGSTAFLSPASITVVNHGIAASVAASAMTIALKAADGTDASATNPVYISFRNATAATGTPVLRAVTGALSTVISSGSTGGSVSGQVGRIYVYAIDNAGTVELAWAGSRFFDGGTLVTTTAEGGGGAADSSITLYSTSARSNVACRYLGRITSTQATAGTWATAPSEINLHTNPVMISTDWEAYTPTFSGLGTVSSTTVFWRREGQDLLINGKTLIGTVAASEARISLPTGLTSASTSYLGATINICGMCARSSSGTAVPYLLIEPATAYMVMSVQGAGGSDASLTKRNGNNIFNSSETISFEARIPIEGWSAYGG